MGAFLSRLSAAQRVGIAVIVAACLYQYRRDLVRMLFGRKRRKRLAPGERLKGRQEADGAAKAGGGGGGKQASSSTKSLKSTATAAVLETERRKSPRKSSPSPAPKPASPHMSEEDIEDRFEKAQEAWPEFQEFASDNDKKRLYGLYKFVLQGAAQPKDEPEEGSKDPILKWKWEAWSAVKGTESSAKREYADLVFSIGSRGGGSSSEQPAAESNPAEDPPAAKPAPQKVAPLPERFGDATQYIKNNGQSLGLDNTTLLKLYAHFKQAMEGDNTKSRPSMFSGPAKTAKWEAYEGCKGMSKELAMQKYINEVTKIDKDWEGGVEGSAKAGGKDQSSGDAGGRSKGGGGGGGGGMGLNVSTMSGGQQTNDGTTSRDWKAHASKLHDAASGGDRETVRQLLSKNGDIVNSTDDVGMTALMYACDGGHEDVVKELLSAKGIDLALKESQDGMTALHYAMCNKNIARALLKAGADVNASDADGTTCLSMCDDQDQGDDRITREEVAATLKQLQ